MNIKNEILHMRQTMENVLRRLETLEKKKRLPWVTQKEAAEEYGLSRTTLYRMRKRGEIRSFKFGNQTCYLRSNIERTIKKLHKL